jgi:hypothetical protein
LLPREVAIALLCLSVFLIGVYFALFAAGHGFY